MVQLTAAQTAWSPRKHAARTEPIQRLGRHGLIGPVHRRRWYCLRSVVIAGAGAGPTEPRRSSNAVRLHRPGLPRAVRCGLADPDRDARQQGPGPLLAGYGCSVRGRRWLASRFLGQGAGGPRHRDGPERSHRRRPWAIVALAADRPGSRPSAVLVAQHGIPLPWRRSAAEPRPASPARFFDLFRWLVPPSARRVRESPLASGQAAIVDRPRPSASGRARDRPSRREPCPFELLGSEAPLLIAWWAGRRLSLRLAAALGAAAPRPVRRRPTPARRAGGRLQRRGGHRRVRACERTMNRVLLIHPQTLDIVARDIPRRQPDFGGSTYVRRLAVLLGQKDEETHTATGSTNGSSRARRWVAGRRGARRKPGRTAARSSPRSRCIVLALGVPGAAWLRRRLARCHEGRTRPGVSPPSCGRDRPLVCDQPGMDLITLSRSRRRGRASRRHGGVVRPISSAAGSQYAAIELAAR